jgi:hypothetical protein
MTKLTPDPLLCPSSRCEKESLLIGVVTGRGVIAFLHDRVEVDAQFVHIARLGRKPESRFRFASACRKSGCAQWTGNRCRVVDTVAELTDANDIATSTVPSCSIRSWCRWHAQNAESACRACQFVVTELDPASP